MLFTQHSNGPIGHAEFEFAHDGIIAQGFDTDDDGIGKVHVTHPTVDDGTIERGVNARGGVRGRIGRFILQCLGVCSNILQ